MSVTVTDVTTESFRLVIRYPGRPEELSSRCAWDGDEVACAFDGNSRRLRDDNALFRGQIEDLLNRFEAQGGGLAAAGDALVELGGIAEVVMSHVFDDNQTAEIRRLLSRYLQGTVFAPAVLEISFPEEAYVPISLLPSATVVFPVVTTPADLLDLAQGMPAYRAVVRQYVMHTGPLSIDHDLAARSQLPNVLFLWNPDAPGTYIEQESLQGHASKGEIAFHGPRPAASDCCDRRAIAALMAGFLVRPTIDAARECADIVHVTAHGDVNPDRLVDSHVIRLGRFVQRSGVAGRLGATDLEEFRVTNRLLRATWDAAGQQRMDPGPVAILSACSSAAGVHLGPRSVVGLLLKFGYRAIVGAEAEVGGQLAADFNAYLYQRIVENKPLGVALQMARAHLLVEKQNPFGILFSLYGDAEIALHGAN